MTEALKFFVDVFRRVVDLLNDTTFELYSYDVSLGSVLMAFLVIGIVISVFWKGAKA